MNKLVISVAIITLLVIGIVSANSVQGRYFWSNWFKEKDSSPKKSVDKDTYDSSKSIFNILRLNENINEKEQKIIDVFRKTEVKK